jgi:hypothetical protein
MGDDHTDLNMLVYMRSEDDVSMIHAGEILRPRRLDRPQDRIQCLPI